MEVSSAALTGDDGVEPMGGQGEGAQEGEEAGDDDDGSRLRSAAAELKKKLELEQAGSSTSGWSFRDLKAALTTRLESAEPSVRKGSMELLAMLGASIKERPNMRTAARCMHLCPHV